MAYRKTWQRASEDDIARKRGFDNAAHLHAQLRAWELPDWLVTGYEGFSLIVDACARLERGVHRGSVCTVVRFSGIL
jgi:hypothetical protein